MSTFHLEGGGDMFIGALLGALLLGFLAGLLSFKVKIVGARNAVQPP